MSRSSKTSRRSFLKATTLASTAVAAAQFVPGAALGLDGATPANSRLLMGCIGTGGKGSNNLGTFLGMDDVRVMAVCDADKSHMMPAVGKVDEKYGEKSCKAFSDFRELIAMDELDVISIATPDHWHALTSIAALDAGKDVYCEKPLTNTIVEGRAVCDAVKRNNAVLQCGSHERSTDTVRYACELVRNGKIGELKKLHINLPVGQPHHIRAMELKGTPDPMPVPDGFDYNMWLGHTAFVPYTEKRCHFGWRFILAYGGGEMTDRGAHVIDLAQLGGGFDETGPVEIKAEGVRGEGMYNVPMTFSFNCKYANGVEMIGSNVEPRGVKFEGTDGWVFINVHGGRLEASDPKLLELDAGKFDIQLGRSPGHHRNFIDCVKSRKDPMATAEIGHRTATICHLNNIAVMTGRPIIWDPVAEAITNDIEMNNMLSPTMRKPWSLPQC